MQPIYQTFAEDIAPVAVKRKRIRETAHGDSYFLTVMCWILGVATFDLLVGFLCAGFFDQYAALLIRLSQG